MCGRSAREHLCAEVANQMTLLEDKVVSTQNGERKEIFVKGNDKFQVPWKGEEKLMHTYPFLEEVIYIPQL